MQTRLAVRVAAMPVATLAALRLEKTAAMMEEIIKKGGWLADQARGLSDELYDQIGAESAAVARPRLVALRRAIYGMRRLPSALWPAETRDHLPGELARRIDEWASVHLAREELTARLEATLLEENAQAVESMRDALHSPAFRYGLVQGSPDLFQELEKWLNGPPDTAPGRQVQLRLAKYLARVVAKTSPYSTFTISGPVEFDDEQTATYRMTGDFEWGSVAELNAWVITSLGAAAMRRPRLRREMRIRRNPSLVSDGERLTFLAPAPQYSVATARHGEAIEVCLKFLGDRTDLTVRELVDHLLATDPALEASAVGAFVAKLIEAGVLCALAPVGDQDMDHVTGLARVLSRDPDAAPLAAGLQALADELHAYPALRDPGDRLARRRRIYHRVESLTAPGRLAIDGRLPRKNLFHENAVFTRPVLTCGSAAWRPLLTDLADLRGVLGLLDPTRPLRKALTRVFTATYGSGAAVGWMRFHQLITKVAASGVDTAPGGVDGPTLRMLRAGPMGCPPDVWARLPFAREQAELRDRGTALMLSSRPDADGVVRLSARHLLRALGQSDDGTAKDPITCYIQLLNEEGPPRAVLNSVTGGYGRGMGRLTRLMRQAGIEADFAPMRRAPEGALLAESDAIFGSNLNLRASCCEYELDLPSVTSTRPPGERIPLADLVVAHDADRDTLYLSAASLGERIKPIHPGIMADLWLPPPLRDLINAFGPPASLLHASMPPFVPRGTDPRDGGLRMLPRLDVGAVTLSRQCWVFPAKEMPLRSRGEPDAVYWLRLVEWTRRQQIPDRFFARAIGVSEATFRPDQKARKPLYVDLTAWHLTALLERVISAEDDLVVFTEAHPDLGDAPRYDSDRHVTEFMVELCDE
ncbi:lantibiotic dehydratase [Spongiactinospora sp. TRM90649]|uniref:lantibiotic dehydratase n=1 Tax=Spongiactinospora sp. TRM90649 TaxID=3031114 RepID=UPI0023FA2B9D|nr:lantibiotic dehydratase [Spongiactinospora sp. TRM90649]MDF5756347.1 lantibiotic dehydratase [Spongiactinospora sp. TRM90649]